MTCGKILGGGMGYTERCGGLWMGHVSKCGSCKSKEIRDENRILQRENLRLQNKILKKQLADLVQTKGE